jgi:hypothetical protein
MTSPGGPCCCLLELVGGADHISINGKNANWVSPVALALRRTKDD